MATGPGGTLDYGYDAVGNRTAKVLSVGASVATDTYLYGASDNRLAQVTEAGGHARTFTYDAAGNITYDNRTGGGYGYRYNAAGRMADMSVNGVMQAEYIYKAQGQQVVRRLTTAGQTIHSVHGLAGNRIAEYDYDPSTQATTLLREYIWMDGTAIGVVEGGVLYFVRTDWIGHPVLGSYGLGKGFGTY